MFKIKADENADKERIQYLLLGASTVSHMMKPVCNREEDEVPIYYMSKPGSTMDDMYKALKKTMEEKVFLGMDTHCHQDVRDELSKEKTQSNQNPKRPLYIVVYMSLNDLNAILDAEYLTDTLEGYRQLIAAFERATGRITRISFTLYMYAPSRREAHGRLSEMNAILEKANTEVFGTATYDPNTRLLKPVKVGRPGNTTVIKPDGTPENFHSDNTITGNWALPGAYHLADKKLREVCKDIRVFFGLGMQEPNKRPWNAYELDMEIDMSEALPTFNPHEEYPTLESAVLHGNRKESNSGQQEEQVDQDESAGGRTLGSFINEARSKSKESAKRYKKSTPSAEEKREKFEREQEERRRQARDAARKKTKERAAKANQAEAEKWQHIKDCAENARAPADNRLDIEENVADLNV